MPCNKERGPEWARSASSALAILIASPEVSATAL